ncbi:AI-2E family transporter [Saccharopolyspora cebuensis]|uniref:AI-2E family transporter n=1 Tax=Saccharopolyspora cebuensis TaxID=418759 RepID=A0ABV4CFT4_9PSEU
MDELDGARAAIPEGVRIAAAWSWRLLLLVGVFVVLWRAGSAISQELLVVAVAVLFNALLAPAVNWLDDRGVHRTLAVVLVLLGGLALIGGVLTVVVRTLVRGFAGLRGQLLSSLEHLHRWLLDGPLNLSQQQLDRVFSGLPQALHLGGGVTATAVTTADAVLRLLAGALLALFTLFFLLRDGSRIWRFLVCVLVPRRARWRVHRAGCAGFSTLVAYVRATAAVAFIDGAGIGIGALVLGVPFPFVIAITVFLGAFVPYIGAVVTGGLAVLVALAANGIVPALIMLAVVVGVMQLEGHVLQPLLLGHAVRLHPLAVVLSVTAGFTIGGVGGAVLAVPVVATGNTIVRALRRKR